MRKPPQSVHSLSIVKTRTRLLVATHGNWYLVVPGQAVRDLGAAGGPRDVTCRPTGVWTCPAARQPLPQLWVNSLSYGQIVKTASTMDQAEDGGCENHHNGCKGGRRQPHSHVG